MTTLAIHGAGGRMGRRLVALTIEDTDLQLGAAVDWAEHPDQGKDAGELAGAGASGVKLSDLLPTEGVDVVIDFSLPQAFERMLSHCVNHRLPVVVGTTGLTEQDHAAIDEAAGSIPVLQAPNMSLGVNLLFALAGQVAKTLGDDYDIEIVEAHHRFKKDAPSGTALGIAEAICGATGKDINQDVVHGREGEAERKRGEIGMHALRMGDVIGEHTASFGTIGERLELKHVATDRDVFVRGALRAAKWLAGKPAGRYGMADVLGLK